MTDKIRTMFVFEIMGRPPEHIVEAMNQFIDKLAEAPGVKIESRKVHEPKKIEKEDISELYSSFAEVELTAENLETIAEVVLNMLPAHVEVIEPVELKMQNFDLSSLFSKIAVKLHRYDEIAKAALMERNVLMKRIEEMQAKINELEKGKKKQKVGSGSKASEKKKNAKKKPVKKKAGKKK